VRGLTSDLANVYAETLFKEDMDGDVLANLSPGNLKELGLSLKHSFKLLQRFKEGLSPVRYMQAETEELTLVPQMPRTHNLAQTPALHVRDCTSFLSRTLSQQQQQAHSLEHPARSVMQMGQQGLRMASRMAGRGGT
jgi:hypothetical protein